MIVGQDRAVGQFLDAWASRRLHHAWLLAGPRGVGKASFAMAAVQRILADAAGPVVGEGLEVPEQHPIAHLLAAGSHPDFRLLKRELNDKGDALRRNISIAQVRKIGQVLTTTKSLSPWRAIVIDSVDDLETEGANALLKMLEEPPSETVFFLVSHAPGRLLATIRSRCRRLDFDPLADDVMVSLLQTLIPDAKVGELTNLAAGSPGRAVQIASLDLAPLLTETHAIIREGDPENARRSRLAAAVSGKAQAERYAAFLDLVPAIVADEARTAAGPRRGRALAAYDKARETVALAPRLSFDPAATAFALGGILASIADPPASLKR